MAAFTQAGYLSPGKTFTVDGGVTPVAITDTLVLNGVKQTLREWIRRGRISLVSVNVNINTYMVLSTPEKEGQMAA